MTTHSLKSALRRKCISRRKALSPPARKRASDKIAALFTYSPFFYNAHRIGAYLGHGGEVDPAHIILMAHQLKKSCYLPVIHPHLRSRMAFAKVDLNTVFVKNRYGILEPKVSKAQLIPPWAMDLVLTPLVAFDAMGNRLGMGGGFYDRAFQHKKTKTKPYLLGLAFECQKLKYVPHLPHDIQCDAILTEKRFYL